ncbi:MAG: ankyrin repeat domain-containing protein [Thiolinea sp.]
MNPSLKTASTAVLLATLSAGLAEAATPPDNAPTIMVDSQPVPQMTQRELDERLWLTALTGNVGAIVQLVEQGANPNIATRYGETAMHAAAARGHLNIVNFLLKKGVSIHSRTANGWTPLHHAARFGHAAVANLLVQAGANPRVPTTDPGHKTPIDIAVDKGDLRMARIMGW